MTQPESRTVEGVSTARLYDALWLLKASRYGDDDEFPTLPEVRTALAAAKEHGLVIGEGELDARVEALAGMPGVVFASDDKGREWLAKSVVLRVLRGEKAGE